MTTLSKRWVGVVLPLVLGACQSTPSKLQLPAPLALPVLAGPAAAASTPAAVIRNRTGVMSTPQLELPLTAMTGVAVSGAEPTLSGAPVTASIENMALPAFIDEVYGNLLHLNFQMDPAVAKQTDLVTVRVPQAQTPQAFYRLVRTVLRTYGVAVEWDGKLVQLRPVRAAAGSEPPLIISGRALPSVPESHRPIFQMIELKNVRASDVVNWLKTAYKMDGLSIDDDMGRNAVILYGKPDVVTQAAQAIAVLDRPALRGHYSIRLSPVFVSARDLASHLTEILNAEGYAASNQLAPNTSVLVLPVSSVNAVLVFAPDQSLLEHVVAWAKNIDQPNPRSGGSDNNLFYYSVRNTKADEIAKVLQGSAGSAPSAAVPGAAAPGGAPAAVGAANTGGGLGASGRLVVDAPRNGLIFRGSAEEWQRLLPLIEQMDKPARQVMIEVTIAEVTLDKSSQFGVNWLAHDSHGKYTGNWQFGTVPATTTSGTPATGSSPSGLTYLLDVNGQNIAQLQAFAQDSRVSILSTPRILVMSGSTASIDVGNEVPTLSSQTTSTQTTGGSSALLQGVEYRKTGIILQVKPTIYSDDRIDLDLSQEVSQAQPAAAGSGVNSPTIFSRVVKTSLSLRDGGSVVLGGLVSDNITNSNGGIPLLKDIPVLGNLFKSNSKDDTKTELVLIIVPYIIENNDQAEAVTHAITRQLKTIAPAALDPAPLKGRADAKRAAPQRTGSKAPGGI